MEAVKQDTMEPLVSIIVPIYNVEPYLRKCVDSIINQTYRNLEIILVDDGSLDNCPQMCDEYKEKDSRVKVIHKPNGGLSDARNAGLDVATGEYVTFIDSDDWYANDSIEVMIDMIRRTGAAIACIRNVSVSPDYSQIEQISESHKVQVLSSHKLIKKICKKKYSTSVCNKLMKKDLWKETRFLCGRLNEDFLALCRILLKDFPIATMEYPGYYYYSRSDSLTHSAASRVRPVLDAIRNSLELKDEAHIIAPNLEKHFARMALYQARTLLFILPEGEMSDSSVSVSAIEECMCVCKKYIPFVSLKLSDKVILRMASYNVLKTAHTVQKMYDLRRIAKWKK